MSDKSYRKLLMVFFLCLVVLSFMGSSIISCPVQPPGEGEGEEAAVEEEAPAEEAPLEEEAPPQE